MAIRAESTSEAILFPRKGVVQGISATYQITLAGGDLQAMRRLGADVPHIIEQAILDYLLRGGELP